MAQKKFIGAADAIAQVETIQILTLDGTPANTSYVVTIGTDEVSVPGITDVDTTAAALQAALAASTNPYFSSITWTVLTDTITGTAKAPGDPFIAASSVVGGTGTIGAVTSVTASSGPNDWNVARNWDGGVVPVSTDDVIIENSSISITHGLDQSAVTLASLTITKDYTGRIGLKENQFATNSNGSVATITKNEYREQYLKISATDLSIGENFTNRVQTGSGMIKVNLGTVVSTVVIHDTATSASEAGKPSVQLLGVNVGNKLIVNSAPGNVGIAVSGFELSTFDSVEIGTGLGNGGVVLGAGVTLDTWSDKSGSHFINAAATMTLADFLGGVVTTNGYFVITTVNINSEATLFLNHTNASPVIGTLNYLGAATVDVTQSSKDRVITNVNLAKGSVLKADNSRLTITNLAFPTNDYELSVA